MGNRISVDPSLNIWNLGLLAVSIIGVIVYGVRVNDQVSENTDDIASVRLDYVVADKAVVTAHVTEFVRLEADFSELTRDVSAQAVSIGRIEAGVEYIVNNLESN